MKAQGMIPVVALTKYNFISWSKDSIDCIIDKIITCKSFLVSLYVNTEDSQEMCKTLFISLVSFVLLHLCF